MPSSRASRSPRAASRVRSPRRQRRLWRERTDTWQRVDHCHTPAWVAVDVPLCSTRRSGARASAPSAAFGEAIEHGDDVDRDPRSVALLTFGLQQHAGVFELADRVEGRLFGDVKAFLDDGRVDRRLPELWNLPSLRSGCRWHAQPVYGQASDEAPARASIRSRSTSRLCRWCHAHRVDRSVQRHLRKSPAVGGSDPASVAPPPNIITGGRGCAQIG